MELREVLLLEKGIVGLVSVIAIFNTRIELFNLEGFMGLFFTGLSFLYLPGHIFAMILTNAADPPDLWGVIVGYMVQGLLIALLITKITRAKYEISNG